MHGEESWHVARERGLPEHGLLLVCDVDRQELKLWDRGQATVCTPVSTSARGVGCLADSFHTPSGWHAVTERIGAGEPAGTVFKERRPTGKVLPEADWRSGDEDLILSRILWLDGLEEGVNRGPGRDSHARFIYLHGTNREDLLGRPASRGCIRLGNHAMVAVFDRVADRPAWCRIVPPAA